MDKMEDTCIKLFEDAQQYSWLVLSGKKKKNPIWYGLKLFFQQWNEDPEKVKDLGVLFIQVKSN